MELKTAEQIFKDRIEINAFNLPDYETELLEQIKKHPLLVNYTLADLYYLWRLFSEELYRTGFLFPNDILIREFITWLTK